MPAVGYEHPDQSHFVSRHFYEVGALDPGLSTGWMGRYLDRVGSPDNPLQGLALDSTLAPALAAGLALLIGTRAAGRMVGEFPGLDALDPQGNLRATADFGAVYAALLRAVAGHRGRRHRPRRRARGPAAAGQVKRLLWACVALALLAPAAAAAAAPARMMVTADEWRLLSSLSEATRNVKSGQYALWCSLRGHRAAGMRATLHVR